MPSPTSLMMAPGASNGGRSTGDSRIPVAPTEVFRSNLYLLEISRDMYGAGAYRTAAPQRSEDGGGGRRGAVVTEQMRSVVEGDQASVGGNQDDGLPFPRCRIAAHAGGVRRHARQRQPDGLRPVGQQAEDGSRRDMTLDHVLIDQRRVAGPSFVGDAAFGFEGGQIWIFSESDTGTEIFQVVDPPPATSSPGLLMDIEGDPGQCAAAGRCGGKRAGGRRDALCAAGDCQGEKRKPERATHEYFLLLRDHCT